jgi:dipeptidyl aminopeptidase/acylaminoacyl peptidase
MKRLLAVTLAELACLSSPQAQVPESLVVDGVPPIPAELKAEAGRYLEFRAAAFNSWHPIQRQLLITTRFADTTQLHLVQKPGGARRQLTFLPEPVPWGSFQPKTGAVIVFAQDTGGGEFYQLYRYDPADGRITLLTDGKSRNTNPRWAKSGQWLAYSSTRRNGKDTDIYLLDPANPKSDRLLLQVTGGGWSVTDWSEDDTRLLLLEYISVNESYVHLVDVVAGAKEQLTPRTAEKAAYGRARFAKDGQSVFLTTDRGADFQRLARLDLASRQITPLTAHLPWDVEDFELSPDGKTLAFVTNEEGVSVLRLMRADSGRELKAPKLPLGVISGLEWRQNGRELAFTLSSARCPSDVYSLDVRRGRVERWTESETGGLSPQSFIEPELVRLKSFDGLSIAAFLYRPDPAKFPGRRPVLISIHGGPEAQARPSFQARNNYFLNELGVAMLCPNVRGSSGYGKAFLTLDNGEKREDAVRDVGAFIDWAQRDPGLDGQRIAVMGGSYGGYMALACMTHYGDRLRAGVDVVGISNFVTFLQNTQDYRRDLRRVEYGDERDPATRDFLLRISPLTSVQKIKKPLLVVQGKNDPRVPATESEQMVKAIRDNGGVAWYLLAKDEGHGFAKKRNQDFQFLATVLFLKENLFK